MDFVHYITGGVGPGLDYFLPLPLGLFAPLEPFDPLPLFLGSSPANFRMIVSLPVAPAREAIVRSMLSLIEVESFFCNFFC